MPRIRHRAKEEKNGAAEDFLSNRVGFENEAIAAQPVEGQEAVTKPSSEWPFQRFSWTDHDANTGDTVSYRVIPVVRRHDGALALLEDQASDWSPPRTLGAVSQSRFKPYFNRGFVMSQFMARYLEENHLSLGAFKAAISKDVDDKIRTFLSGDLRKTMLQELATAKADGTEVFGALFELSDPELIEGLCALGPKAHLVLANGSVTKPKGVPSAVARKGDENKKAREKLMTARCDVEADSRFLSPGPLGHNKFLVFTDLHGKPLRAWTGSTNWTPTGLCTQLNNGLLVDDPEVAAAYHAQWQRLREAGSDFPAALVSENGRPKQIGGDNPGRIRSTVWFSRTRKGVDLDALREEVQAAQHGILFLMFMPGGTGLFSTVAARSAEPGLYVRGVVSELPNGRGDESAVDVNLIDGRNHRSLHLDIVEPQGVDHPFANFAEEVTRKQFLGGIGHAIVHSKVVVIDPFSDDPTVITGSHNFSISASSKNDENFIIIKGDHDLAEAYAVNILGAYAHYRWRAFLGETNRPFNGLKDNDRWMGPRLKSEQRDLAFWGLG